MSAAQYEDFTEAAYRGLVAEARQRYTCLSFEEAAAAESGVLWRHDIDISVHRALALAKIEHEAGLQATVFVHLHSRFYNAFEGDIAGRLRAIADLGHLMGLHFDPHAHALAPGDAVALERAVAAEAAALQSLAGVTPVAVSLHDPDLRGWETMDAERLGGLPNAYGRTIKARFAYCSDSNGYWRFTPLADALTAGHARLHVLTHPEWWVPDAMPPRARIQRAIDGRAAAVARTYDEILAAIARENLH
ncbi:MAG: hypothetical protein Q8L86_16605 [Vicinamibacterales bacterium]|nr:hypothetical protein [Vicinamibacterales bacterium]